jgi:hypothetical protein
LRFLEFLFTMGCAYGIQEPSQARKRMIDRAPLPDFELPATGTPRYPLSAFHGPPFELNRDRRVTTPGTVERTLSSTTRQPPECPPIP